MNEQKQDISKLAEAGFEGSIDWVHNEEGNGAMFYHSSVYFPDSLLKPKTNCGVTIDPGVDMGTANLTLINGLLNEYYVRGFLTSELYNKLKTSIGLRGRSAAAWYKQNKNWFRHSFLVPDFLQKHFMENLTAIQYWKPLVGAMPNLLKIKTSFMKKAVHTALLSMSYNRGWQKTILLAGEFIASENYDGLAKKISNVKQSLKSLKERRQREAELIYAAIETRNDFVIELPDINPMPVTEIPSASKEIVMKELEFELKHVELL